VPLRQSQEVGVGGLLVARQNRKRCDCDIVGQKTVSRQRPQGRKRFSSVFKFRLICARHADSQEAGFRKGASRPLIRLQEPSHQSTMVHMTFPTATQQHIDIKEPAAHGKSSSNCLTIWVVMGGAPGGASSSNVPLGPLTSSAPDAPEEDTSAGRRRTARKRNNSSFCSCGRASVAASISSSVLMCKV